jgi:hypothetical protein
MEKFRRFLDKIREKTSERFCPLSNWDTYERIKLGIQKND